MNLFAEPYFLDLAVGNALSGIASPGMDTLMIIITNLGAPMLYYALTAVSVIFLTYKRKMAEGVFLFFCLISSWGMMNFLKLFFMRPRPTGEQLVYAGGYSFPSGHATLAVAFYGFIIYLLLASQKNRLNRCLSGLIAVLIFLIGVSRVYLNVHYATDVIAGFILGSFFLAVFIILLKYYKARF